MDQNLCSGLEEKPSCPVNKSVKGLLNEVQSVYGEKLRRLECEIKCSPEEILKMKVQILHSYISDLSDQNRILVHTVEELEKEANEKVTDLKAKLQTSDEGIKDLDCQRRRLEEDNKSLRAEIQQLKGDARTLVTCLPLRPQTLENVAERSDLSTRISFSSRLPKCFVPGRILRTHENFPLGDELIFLVLYNLYGCDVVSDITPGGRSQVAERRGGVMRRRT
ncbi:hypothetical protein C0J45_17657 [Silurus meridionalis]|nr:hypothetical protein C0J45_17657 [Silurus meridionalis]